MNNQEDDEIKSPLVSKKILPSKREIKVMIESGEWNKLGEIFEFEPKFLMQDDTHAVIDWLCVPPPMVAILQEKEPRIVWNKPIAVNHTSPAAKQVPSKSRRKSHPKTKVITFLKQDGICHYCGNRIYEFKRWTTDHRVPLCRGGNNAEHNKIGACYTCNHEKGPMTEDEFFATPPGERKNKIKEIGKMLDAYNRGGKVALL